MIAITGGEGFIGSHLFNYFKYVKQYKNVISISKSTFNKKDKLKSILKNASCIIHLAGINRANDDRFIYEENLLICQQIIDCLTEANHYPRFINISSIHENKNSSFGKAKLKIRLDLERFYQNHESKLLSFITPNIFGPFCRPNYNSFVATFCHNIINNESIKIPEDKVVNLLYIDELIQLIDSSLDSSLFGKISAFQTHRIALSEVEFKLKNFQKLYVEEGIIPKLDTKFNLNLFNTFRSYIPLTDFPKYQKKHSDDRGYFSEIIKTNGQGQVSISSSLEGIERGNHFHTRKIERFQILKGRAEVQLRKINSSEIITISLTSENLAYLDIPIWYTHNLINKSENEELLMLFWINEHYNPNNHDTYHLKVKL